MQELTFVRANVNALWAIRDFSEKLTPVQAARRLERIRAVCGIFVLGLTNLQIAVILVPVVMDSSIGVWSSPSLSQSGTIRFFSRVASVFCFGFLGLSRHWRRL